MEVDATLAASTYPDTMRDTQIDEQTLQMSQEGTVNEMREEHEEARRELVRPQQPFRWQATTEVETLTEQPGPTLQWASRTQEKRVGRLLTENLADAVTATKQAPGSNWEWQTHCKLWATPQILLRTPLSTGEDETNPSKGTINTVREIAETCKYPEGGNWETPERQAKLEKARRKLVMEDVKNQMEAQSEETAQFKKAQAAVRKTRGGNMRGAIQALTGDGAPSDANFAEESGSTTALLQTADGWTEWNVERGTWQGACCQPHVLPRVPPTVPGHKEEDREWTRRRDAKGCW